METLPVRARFSFYTPLFPLFTHLYSFLHNKNEFSSRDDDRRALQPWRTWCHRLVEQTCVWCSNKHHCPFRRERKLCITIGSLMDVPSAQPDDPHLFVSVQSDPRCLWFVLFSVCVGLLSYWCPCQWWNLSLISLFPTLITFIFLSSFFKF